MPKTIQRQAAFNLAALGAAITLLGNLDPLITIAGWARFLVEHWRILTSWVWDKLFALMGLQIGNLTRSLLTFATFVLLASLAAARASARPDEVLLRDDADDKEMMQFGGS